MKNPKFKVLKSVFSNQYYYTLRSAQGERLLSSEGYDTKQCCLKDISLVKAYATLEGFYERKEAPHYSFYLQAPGGKIIGRSEAYRNRFGRDTGMLAVRRDAPRALIEDLAF